MYFIYYKNKALALYAIIFKECFVAYIRILCKEKNNR